MQFYEMNCTIFELNGRFPFELSPTPPPEHSTQPMNFSDRTTDSDDLDFFNATDDFKILVH